MRDRIEIEAKTVDIDPEAVAGGPSRFPFLNYEQGVNTALRWASGATDDDPLED